MVDTTAILRGIRTDNVPLHQMETVQVIHCLFCIVCVLIYLIAIEGMNKSDCGLGQDA